MIEFVIRCAVMTRLSTTSKPGIVLDIRGGLTVMNFPARTAPALVNPNLAGWAPDSHSFASGAPFHARCCGRRRVLTLSGGGLRGVIAAAVLERIEHLGRKRRGQSYRLADDFDFVCGASTGSVMATAIALGVEARRIVAFYRDDAPTVFRRRTFAVPGVHALFSSKALGRHYLAATEGRRLRRADLLTDLGVVVKDVAVAAPVLMTSLSGRAEARERCLGAEISTHPVDLAELLRASTAAPGLFTPVRLPAASPGCERACVDGGLTPFNDPSLLAWSYLDDPAQGLRWGRDGVDLIAIGAGATGPRYRVGDIMRRPAALLAMTAMRTMIEDCERQSAALLSGLSHACADDPVPALRFTKLDMPLDAATFASLGMVVTRTDLRRMRDIADPRGTRLLYEAAARYAETMIVEAFPDRASATPLETAA